MTEHGFEIRHCDTFLDRIVFELGLDGCKLALTPGCEQLKPGGADEKASWLNPLDAEQAYTYRKLVWNVTIHRTRETRLAFRKWRAVTRFEFTPLESAGRDCVVLGGIQQEPHEHGCL